MTERPCCQINITYSGLPKWKTGADDSRDKADSNQELLGVQALVQKKAHYAMQVIF
jgi:hypothetical protein